MTICTLTFETGVIYWCLSLVSIFVLMYPIFQTIYETGIFGRRTSVLFAGGLLTLCFAGLCYVVAHNKLFQSITDKAAFVLLAELIIYSSSAVCLYIVTVFGFIVKTLRTKKENTDGD